MFQSFDRMVELTKSKSEEGAGAEDPALNLFANRNILEHQQQMDEQPTSILYAIISRVCLLSAILYISVKMPQNMEMYILQVCGGLFSTILFILFPILLFNKTHKSYDPESSTKEWRIQRTMLRLFNWLLFIWSIGVGGFGVY